MDKKQSIRPVAVIATFVLICVALGVFLADCQRDEQEEFTSEISSLDEIFTIPVIEPESVSEIESEEHTTAPENSPTVAISATIVAVDSPESDDNMVNDELDDCVDDRDDYVEEDDDGGHGDYIGNFKLTAYEWTGQPMANGEMPYYGACACNIPKLWGKYLYIEGYGTFKVCDRGGMSGNWIDIYLGDEDTCWDFGVQYADVYYG